MSQRTIQDKSARPFVQIDADLIWALTNAEFKAYAQIKKRAAASGECWESLEHMAAETQTSPSTLKRSLKGLMQKGLISKTKRPGNSDLYELTPPTEWVLPQKADITQAHIKGFDPGQNDLPPRSKWSDTQVKMTYHPGQNDLQIRSRELDPKKEKEAPSPFRLDGSVHRVEQGFTCVEEEPWLERVGDVNSINVEFAEYVQSCLDGRGHYEKTKATIADAKAHIRRYRTKVRGSEERQALHAAMLDKWSAFKERDLNPEVIKPLIGKQLNRLNWTGMLTEEYQDKWGVVAISDLQPAQQYEYLQYLKSVPTGFSHAA